MVSPEKEKRIRLMLRQLADAQVQAGNILAGDRHRATIETFARFCTELNHYIRTYADSDEIAAVLDDIPEIQYKRLPGSFWQHFFTPLWVTSIRRSTVLEQVRRVREGYSRLESRLRGMNFGH